MGHGLGEAGEVEPVTPPAFTEGWIGQIPVYPACEVFGSRIGQKGPHFFRRRRQSAQIVRQAPEQRRRIDVPRRSRQARRLSIGEHEGVHLTPAPLPVPNGGQGRVLKRAERPRLGVDSTGGNPLFQSPHLIRSQRLPLGRHAFVWIGMHHPSQQRTRGRLAGHNGHATRFQQNGRALHRIQSQPRLAGLGVWAMAGVAFGRQNGTHRTGEIRPRSHHPAGPQNESSEGKDGAQPATHRWKDSGHCKTLPSKACIGNAHRRSTHPPGLPAGAGPIPRHPARRSDPRFLHSLRGPCSPTSIPQRP